MIFKAVYQDVPLHRNPHPDSPEIGLIEKGTIVEVSKRDHHWINPAGIEGWAASTTMERLMDVPAPDLEFHSNGHKLIDGKYRNFFGVNNIGLLEYTGDIQVYLFAGCKQVHAGNFKPGNGAIQAPGGRAFHIDTDVEVTEVEFTDDAKCVRLATKGTVST